LHADTGEEQAVILLAVWGTASPDVQLAARRAAAGLLRWQTSTPREFLSSGMWHQGARLLVALLDAAGPLAAVVPADLQDPQDGSGPGQPDEAAVLAAGDPGQLAAACAGKLAAIASDSVDSIVSRHHAVAALRMLLPHLSADLCARLAGDLARLHANPGLSEQDMWDLQSLRPLSSGHIDSGARTFSAAVLLAAAEGMRPGRRSRESRRVAGRGDRRRCREPGPQRRRRRGRAGRPGACRGRPVRGRRGCLAFPARRASRGARPAAGRRPLAGCRRPARGHRQACPRRVHPVYEQSSPTRPSGRRQPPPGKPTRSAHSRTTLTTPCATPTPTGAAACDTRVRPW